MKQGWKEIKMVDACELITCGVASTPIYVDEKIGVPFLSAQNVRDGEVVLDKYSFISKEFHQKLTSKNKPSKGDILYSRVGAKYGEAGVVEHDFEFSVYVSVTLIRPKKHLLNNYFLKNYLNSPRIKDIAKKSISSSGVPNLNVNSVRDFLVPIPPLPEQQRIVAILDEAFAAIAKAKANAEQNLKNAKELFDVYLHKFYTSKEEGWEEKKLKEVAEYFNGLTYSPKNVSNEGIIVLRSSNVQNDELDFKDIVRVNLTVKEKIIVKDGDILMCSRNGSARLVGKTATIKNLDEEMTFGTFMMIIRSQYNPYLSWFFKSTDFRDQIKGGENNMINQITRYMLDDVVLSFPPIEKQNEVVKKLNALHLETKKLEAIYQQKINDLEELKKSILQKAFAGELRSPEGAEYTNDVATPIAKKKTITNPERA
jgi:type I restriction enzyme S subunit